MSLTLSYRPLSKLIENSGPQGTRALAGRRTVQNDIIARSPKDHSQFAGQKALLPATTRERSWKLVAIASVLVKKTTRSRAVARTADRTDS